MQNYINCFEQKLAQTLQMFECTSNEYQGFLCVPSDFCIYVQSLKWGLTWKYICIGLQITMENTNKKHNFFFNKPKTLFTFRMLKDATTKRVCGSKNQNTSRNKTSKQFFIQAFICGETASGKKMKFFGNSPPRPILIYENNSLFKVMKTNGARKWRSLKENAKFPKNKDVLKTGYFVIRRYPRHLY